MRRKEPQNKSVLVVDDEYVIRQIIEAALRAAGYDVGLADSGEVAFKLVREGRFDAALLDVNLPGIDGIELHRRIRKHDRRLARRCLFMSGQLQPESACEYFSAHGAGLLGKPFGAAGLQAALRRVWSNGDGR